jgi:hypothetical protein
MSPVHPMWLATPAVACLALAASALSPNATGGKPLVLPAPTATAVSATLQADARAQYARLPLSFERNVGQTDAQVQYFARGAGYGLFLTPTEAVFSLHQAAGRDAISGGRNDVVRMRLAGARSDARAQAARPQAGVSHYLQGDDARQWRRNVERYEQVRYSGVYDGVDLVYYGNQQEMEYDFVVAPGADPAQIGLDFRGPKAMRIDDAGNLVLATAVGDMVQRKPVAYQEIDGQRRLVDARYRVVGDRVTFALGDYDRDHALVIDPILVYSTMLGGTGDEFASSIAVDGAGNMYVTGTTTSTTFPTGTPMQAANAGQNDVFVTKFNPAGSALVYSTYLGGTGSEIAYGMALDSANNVYLTGVTLSTNYPTKTPVQGTLKGTRNMFVTKLAANGASLVYSTYLGAKSDIGLRIAVDSTGAAVVGGYGNGVITWPTGAYQATFGGGASEDPDGILFKLNPAGTAIVWGTYLGGALEDSIEDVKVDAANNVYFAGHGKSPTLPVRNAYQATHGGNVDAVFGKFNAAGQAQFVSFFGGPNSEGATGVAVDRNGAVYIAGHGYANSLPVKAPMQQGNAGNWDAFVSKFNATGSALVYSTYLGGIGNEEVAALGVNSSGHAYVVGRTDSVNFPSASPFQQDFKGGGADGFISVINASGTDFVWSSLVGGPSDDNLLGLAVAANGNAYVSGRTYGAFPTIHPYQSTAKGNRDAVVLRVGGVTWRTSKHVRLDLNDEGRADILWRNPTNGQHILWYGASASVTGQVATRPAPWTIGAIGDFDGDHRGDLFWRNTTTGANEIWRSGRAVWPVSAQVNPAWTVVGAGDFTGDARYDVVWRNTTTGANELWLSGNASQRQALVAMVDQNWKVAGIGDFNADNKDDLLWRNATTGANEVWLSGLQSQRQALASADANWVVGGVGDINKDLKADIIWRNSSTGANVAWLAGTTVQNLTATTEMAWKIVGVADYNGDGKADILWRKDGTGENIIWNSALSTTLRSLPAITDPAWVAISR